MVILNFFNKESDVPKGSIIFSAIIAGISNSFILAIINQAAERISHNDEVTRLFFMFILTVILFIYTRKHSLSHATIAMEEAIRKVRVRIANKIRNSELSFIENTNKTDIYTYLTQDTTIVSQSALTLTLAVQSAIILGFCLFYIAWLAPVGAILTLAGILTAVFMYLSHYQTISKEIHLTNKKEAEFFSSLDNVLDGFKELKINRNKSDALFAHLERISRETEAMKVSVGLKFVIDIMFSRVFAAILLGVIVFIMPMFSPTQTTIVVKIATTILFIIGPVEIIVGAIPVFLRANVAIENIKALEANLDRVNQKIDEHPLENISEFNSLELKEIQYSYVDKENRVTFEVGPLNLTVQQGEIIFIVGGNGSGKSTLLKLFTGLYYPEKGSLLLNGEVVELNDYPSYRELFSAIFFDFHLFDRLYGLQEVDEARLKELLKTMELSKKTRYVDGKFSNTNLSTGQRKRLAFIEAVLEDKLIYVFDEWAADQDPAFRKYFYEVLLKNLKNEGKTVIAVTHDDRYFEVADRVLKMEYGKLTD